MDNYFIKTENNLDTNTFIIKNEEWHKLINELLSGDEWRYELLDLLDKYPENKSKVITTDEINKLISVLDEKKKQNERRRASDDDKKETNNVISLISDELRLLI